MSYKDQTMTPKEMDKAMAPPPLSIGETYVEFVRVRMNEYEGPMEYNDPLNSQGEDYVEGYDREIPKQLLINVTLRAVEESPTNKNRYVDMKAAVLLDSNDDPVLTHRKTKNKLADLGRMLIAFYGGKNVRQTPDYPTDGDGTILGPLNILNNEDLIEGLVGRSPVSVAVLGWKNKDKGTEGTYLKSWSPIQ